MPKATVDMTPQNFELKSLEGAYIQAKPLSYGQKKERDDASSRMYSEFRENQKKNETNKMFLDSMSRQSTLFAFQHCLVDHNLEDDNGQKLNFNNDATLDILDPKVGSEIEKILEGLNGDDVDMTDF